MEVRNPRLVAELNPRLVAASPPSFFSVPACGSFPRPFVMPGDDLEEASGKPGIAESNDSHEEGRTNELLVKRLKLDNKKLVLRRPTETI